MEPDRERDARAEQRRQLRRELGLALARQAGPPVELDTSSEHARAVHLEILRPRVKDALDLEAVCVPLDGAEDLTFDEAERLLAQKEEKRLYAPLREKMTRALAPFESREAERRERFSGAPLDDERLSALRETLEPAAVAALDPLGTELARAKDPVDPHGGYSEDAAKALSHALLAHDLTPRFRLTAARAPRALSGHVVVDDEREVARVYLSVARRGARFFAALEGRCTATICALVGPRTPLGEVACALLGTAFAVGLSSAVCRKARLDEPKARARARERETRALLCLETWLQVSACTSDAEEQLEITAERLGEAIELPCAIPWPGLGPLSAPFIATGGRALRSARAAALATALTEHFDEAFPRVRAPLERIRESAGALDEGLSPEALFEVPEHQLGRPLVDGLWQVL